MQRNTHIKPVMKQYAAIGHVARSGSTSANRYSRESTRAIGALRSRTVALGLGAAVVAITQS